ncbi:succinyldiaminopimelate transaminase [Pseudactinotalea terrae]|uniref:succinyldiaminopimelate transaminase n=1 Tax=Pseudactinotalea terrae TaxID=1743262 RepID=UPI0012E18C5D|nr:succinyldiaminopimelate transaminase [Pseudactinotalea terrae]
MGFVAITEDYPWDKLAPYVRRAKQHPGGIVDLSIGTPVDPTPKAVQAALAGAADAPGYPTVAGIPALRQAMVDWFARRRGVEGLTIDGVMATIGSKELVGLLPSLLGIGAGDVVVIPASAYPTYEVGARAAGAEVLATDDVAAWAGDARVRLVWVNSPGNPTGAVAPVEKLREIVEAARGLGAVVASDECYAELGWVEPWSSDGVPCLLDPRVAGDSHAGLLAAYSLSKQSNLAGYRAGLLAGDTDLMARIVLMRRHLGLMLPHPVQVAMAVALADDEHVAAQREIYRARRALLLPALHAAGFTIDHSEAGLYLWARALDGGDCWATLDRLADLGIIAGAGAFYGPGSEHHVRFALTAPDDRIAAAAARLTAA